MDPRLRGGDTFVLSFRQSIRRSYNLVGVLLFLPWVYNYLAPLLSRAGRFRAAWSGLGLGPLFLLFFRLQYFLGFDDFRAGF